MRSLMHLHGSEQLDSVYHPELKSTQARICKNQVRLATKHQLHAAFWSVVIPAHTC